MTMGRPWDMPRDPNADYFDDYMGDNEAPSMFGPGMKDYDRVQVEKTRQGLAARFHCRGCSSDVRLDVEWHEIYVVSMMPVTADLMGGNPIVPPEWTLSEINGTAYPAMKCGKCGALCALHFTPAECRREIETAIESRMLSQQALMAHPAVRHILGMIHQAEQAQQNQMQRR